VIIIYGYRLQIYNCILIFITVGWIIVNKYFYKNHKALDYSKIQFHCDLKGITIKELATKIGMSSSLYTTIKRQTMTIETLEKIAEVLDVPVTEFFENRQNEKEVFDKIKSRLMEAKKHIRNNAELVNRIFLRVMSLWVAYASFRKGLSESEWAKFLKRPNAIEFVERLDELIDFMETTNPTHIESLEFLESYITYIDGLHSGSPEKGSTIKIIADEASGNVAIIETGNNAAKLKSHIARKNIFEGGVKIQQTKGSDMGIVKK
jgi:transcriptional regulator with XRE-family HTH domain